MNAFWTQKRKNVAQSFQRFIDEVLHRLYFSYTYIDDVLITSNTTDEHGQHLRVVFEHFKQYGVIINPSKGELGVESLQFLGNKVDSSDMINILQ